MGTEILPPSDLLNQRLGFFPAPHKPSRKPRRPPSDFRKFAGNPTPKGLDLDPAQLSFPSNSRDRRRAPPSLQCQRDRPIVDDLAAYAGSGFSQSPSPTSLPMPSFSKRKEGFDGYDQLATRDLRRLLRIE